MSTQSDEEKLRSGAPLNARSILAARQRAERALIESNEALEHRTAELAKANRRLILLNQVANKLILGDPPQRYLKAAFDAVAEELEAQYYFNYLVDENEPGSLILRASRGVDAAQELAIRRIALGQHLSGRVALSRHPLTVENIHLRDDQPSAAVRALGIKAYAGLPLLAHDRLFGTIAFGSTRHERFSDADLGLLKTLADQFAASFDRARLLQNLRESETRYRSALKTGLMGAWETDLASGTRLWSDEGMALFGLSLPGGVGSVGGEADELRSAMHPDDRHMFERIGEQAAAQGSFTMEYRIVMPGGQIRWLAGRGQVVSRDANDKPLRLISIVADISERKASEDHIRLLMREVSHRSKNLLSVVRAIADQTGRTAATMEEFQAGFSGRLLGLSASHDLLVREDWQGAPLADLVRQQLAAFVDVSSPRLLIEGPDVIVTATAAQALGLVLHELATNAVKYGALSVPTGTVTISWSFSDDAGDARRLRLRWAERGGPPVAPPARRGFGHVVIEGAVAQSVSGDVTMAFEPQGVVWTLLIPMSTLVREPRDREAEAS